VQQLASVSGFTGAAPELAGRSRSNVAATGQGRRVTSACMARRAAAKNGVPGRAGLGGQQVQGPQLALYGDHVQALPGGGQPPQVRGEPGRRIARWRGGAVEPGGQLTRTAKSSGPIE